MWLGVWVVDERILQGKAPAGDVTAFEAGTGRGCRREGPRGQPGEADASEGELGEEMGVGSGGGSSLSPGRGEGQGCPRERSGQPPARALAGG